MHCIVHANWLRVVVFQEIGVKSSVIFFLHHHVSARHGSLKVVFGQVDTLWVHSKGQVFHKNHIVWLSLLVWRDSNVELVCSQDLADAWGALLVEWSTHVLEVGLSKLTEHPHLVRVDHLHHIFLVVWLVEFGLRFTSWVVCPEGWLEQLLILVIEWTAVELSQGLEVRWEVNFNLNVCFWVK